MTRGPKDRSGEASHFSNYFHERDRQATKPFRFPPR
jgi:hypothetical protein